MEKEKIIIIALIAVIAVLLAGIFAVMPNFAKTDSQLEIMGNDTLNEGDNLQIKLTDANGTALANQTVNITIIDENKSTDCNSVVTNNEGIGELKLDKNASEYEITVIYDGNDSYNGCNATKKITIKKSVVEENITQQSSSSQSNELYYDEELNVYYNSEGITVDPDGEHWHGAGESYKDLRDERDRWERGEQVMV